VCVNVCVCLCMCVCMSVVVCVCVCGSRVFVEIHTCKYQMVAANIDA